MSFFLTSPGVIDLGVNIDHVATLRNARGTRYPDPIRAALQAEAQPQTLGVTPLTGPAHTVARQLAGPVRRSSAGMASCAACRTATEPG